MRSQRIQARSTILSAVLTTALDAVVVTDSSGVIVGWNMVAADMFGWAEEEALGRELSDLIIPQALREKHLRGMERFIRSGEPRILGRRVETTGLRKNGQEFPVELSVVESLDVGERVFLGFLRDLTERKRAEAAAIEWQAVSAAAQRINHVGVWQLDPVTEKISWSDEMYRVFGLAPGSPTMTLETVADLVPEEDRAEVVKQFETAIQKNSIDFEHRIVRRAGEIRHLRVRGEWVKPGAGLSERMIGTIQDISDHKQAREVIAKQAEDLRCMQAQLVHAHRETAMGTMAATLAHELNQPLTAIANYASGLRKAVAAEPGSAAETGIAAVQDNAIRAGEIIRRMRALAKQGEIVKEPVCLDELIRDSIPLLGGRVSIRQSGGHKFRIPGDRVQLQQVLVNLMRNACEAVAGCADPRVEVSCRDIQGAVGVRVTDNGAGIAPDLLPRVFDAHVSTKSGGMGIGLSICRTIIEAHGGTLTASSEEGGTCFRFVIPPA